MKKILLICFLLINVISASAQDIAIQNGMFNQCTGVFTDSGAGGNYGDNENFTVTICPDTPGTVLTLDFTSFSTQANADVLTIYDGDSNTAPVLGTYSGGPTNSPGLVLASATNASGCLTINFTSDATGNTVGWTADIQCAAPCQTITASIDNTNPVANSSGVVETPINTNVNFEGSAAFSDSAINAVFTWDFGDSTTATGEDVNHSYTSSGAFTVTLTVTDPNPLGCSDSTTIQVLVLSPHIEVDETTYTVQELVEDILINSDCSLVSNIQSSTGTDFGSVNGIGYFSGGVGNFDFNEGIILSTGTATAANGPETNDQSNGTTAWPGDADLAAAIGLNLNDTFNATYIQFDFLLSGQVQ
jgi:PKD repeat protein